MQSIDCLHAFASLLRARPGLSGTPVYAVHVPDAAAVPFVLVNRVGGLPGDEAPEMQADIDVHVTAETPAGAQALYDHLIPLDCAQGLDAGQYHFAQIEQTSGPIDIANPLTSGSVIFEVFSTWQVIVCPA